MRVQRLSLLLAVSFSLSSFAANGPLFIGLSPVSHGMGGVAVGNVGRGLDAMYRNAALLAEQPAADGQLLGELDFSFLKTSTTANHTIVGSPSPQNGVESSGTQAGLFFPSMAAIYRFNSMVVAGLGISAIGGASNDFNGNPLLNNLQVDNRIFRVMPSVAVKPIPGFSIGVTPFITYGELSINNGAATQSTRSRHGASAFGLQVGAATTALKPLTIGISYMTKTTLRHEGVIDLDAFGPAAGTRTDLDAITAQYPAEYALGLGYDALDNLKFAFDVKYLGWNNGQGFRELGWDKQLVLAFGTQLKLDAWTLRAGWNYAKSPVSDQNPEGGGVVDIEGHFVAQQAITLLNLAAFDPLSEHHITLGGGYQATDALSVDAAFVYAPRGTKTRGGPFSPGPTVHTLVGSNAVLMMQAGVKYAF